MPHSLHPSGSLSPTSRAGGGPIEPGAATNIGGLRQALGSTRLARWLTPRRTNVSASLPCAIALCLVACGGRRSPQGKPFTARVTLNVEPVFLNQPLTVCFSEHVDALSVTADTIRVVDGEGHAVNSLRREVGSKSVTIHPRAPVEPTLDDGSFAPGKVYWHEVAGYPQINSVRSRLGNVLERSLRVALPMVSRQGTTAIPRPLLPPAPHEFFALELGRRIEVQVESGVLPLHFTLPPYPPSVRPEGFIVQRLAGTLQRIDVVAAQVVRDAPRHLAGTTVELRLRADPPLARNDSLWLVLAKGEAALVDYAGRSVSAAFGDASPRQVFVQSGAHELARVMAADSQLLATVDLETPGFEVRDRARWVPRVRVAAGSGVHGVLRPSESAPLGPGEAFKLSGGRVVRADATLELTGIDIPEGVRLTIGGFAEPVRILVTGSVRIAGELVLETPRGPVKFDDPQVEVRDENLDGLAGCVVVAAGDIEITGRVEHVHERAPMGPAFALVAGGRLALHGRVPPGTICASEGGVVGNMQSSVFRPLRLRPGYSGLTAVLAVAYTPWLPMPLWVQDGVVGTAIEADPGVEVLWQSAPPNAIDGNRVDQRRDTWSSPRPLNEPLVGGAGLFVRFVLRARLEPGQNKLPTIGGIRLHER